MYGDRAAALERAKAASTIANLIDDTYAGELLDLSAGELEDVTEYRPFWVAAKLVEQLSKKKELIEAKNVKFSLQLDRLISSLYGQQRSIDLSQSTVVPDGMEAIDPDCDACGNRPNFVSYAATSTTIRRGLQA